MTARQETLSTSPFLLANPPPVGPPDALPPDAPSLQLACRHEADTAHLAQRLARRLQQVAPQGAFITLRGGLGAGKTTFTRHLLRALGVAGRIKSPTYAVMEPHATPAGLAVAHFDFYRFSDPAEWEDAGLRDVFAAPGLKLAEWPEQAGGLLPVADLDLRFAVEDEAKSDANGNAGGDADSARRITLAAGTPLGRQLLDTLNTREAA